MDYIVWDIEGEASAAESDEQLTDGSSNPAANSTEGHRRQIEDMKHAVWENREPIVDGHEGRRSLEGVCALYRASEESGLNRLGRGENFSAKLSPDFFYFANRLDVFVSH